MKETAAIPSSGSGLGFISAMILAFITNRGLKFLSLPAIDRNPEFIIYSAFVVILIGKSYLFHSSMVCMFVKAFL